ncbi:MAG: AAA family ATPase, partial [Actinobacteria bacterium]|nr:AAA family ATPase [Actinomycetota bacterium]
MELKTLGQSQVIRSAADVAVARELVRSRRIRRLRNILVPIALWALFRLATGNPITVRMPEIGPEVAPFLPGLGLMVLLALVLVVPLLGAGRSPHVLYRPSEIDVCLDDVKGNGVLVDEVVRTVNLFLAHKTFREKMGGTARRAILFEGPPGTGKTYMAKAMAREAGVPYLFVSSSAFQSMYYGQTNRKIRSYFKALRKFAREEGGAIGFIEEIDAIAMSRGGVASGMTGLPTAGLPATGLTVSGRQLHGCHGTAALPASYASLTGGFAPVTSAFASEGTGGVVNELLVQLQSFDDPTGKDRLKGWFVDRVNLLLPPHRQLQRPAVVPTNILLIAATNRADGLDPALLRPGRFDRRITFEVPAKAGRRTLIDHFLETKAHTPELDDPELRDALASVTQAYTPVMIEHLLDEALVNAVRRGETALTYKD